MTLKSMAEKDNLIMRVLKISDISHILAKTNKGDLTLRLAYEGTEKDYRFVLDAVPVEDKQNKELLDLFDGILYGEDKLESIINLLDKTVTEVGNINDRIAEMNQVNEVNIAPIFETPIEPPKEVIETIAPTNDGQAN